MVFDEKIIALYATEVSAELISRVTDAVHEEVLAWQSRPLEETYAVVSVDALVISGDVVRNPIYVRWACGKMA